jgi:hypothetical protein
MCEEFPLTKVSAHLFFARLSWDKVAVKLYTGIGKLEISPNSDTVPQ